MAACEDFSGFDIKKSVRLLADLVSKQDTFDGLVIKLLSKFLWN